jgi:hypothetical protein
MFDQTQIFHKQVRSLDHFDCTPYCISMRTLWAYIPGLVPEPSLHRGPVLCILVVLEYYNLHSFICILFIDVVRQNKPIVLQSIVSVQGTAVQ